MKGRTNNPAGRPPSLYVPPHSKLNDLGMWQVPPAETLLYHLKKEGGNLSKLLKKYCKAPEHEESLLVAIFEELDSPGNEIFHNEWNLLIEKNESARLILLEQLLLGKLEDDDEEKKKFGASEVTALKFVLQTRLAERYATNKKDIKPKGSGTVTPEQQELADKLAKLAEGGGTGVHQ